MESYLKNKPSSPQKFRIRKVFIIFCVFVAIFIVSLTGLLRTLQTLKDERNAFNEITKIMEESETSSLKAIIIPSSSGSASPSMLPKYKILYEMNPDMVGWLCVEDTEINYPVMFTPDDPEYYLLRAFDKTASQSGVPFLGEGCETDDNCIIIHGHNMKNDSMFGSLDNYAKKSFWEKNPTFRFDTLYEERTYEVIAVIETRVLYTDEKGFRYYNYYGDLTEEQFNEFMTEIQKIALYDTGVSAEYGDKLLMLSTCGYHSENGRFVVIAKQSNL